MAQGLEHERMRFSAMNERQLFARLNKITTEEKLRNFISMAWEFKHLDLMKAAERRLEDLFGVKPFLRVWPVDFLEGAEDSAMPYIPPPPPRPQTPPIQTKREPPKEYRRALQF
jgi:hypothetical protein